MSEIGNDDSSSTKVSEDCPKLLSTDIDRSPIISKILISKDLYRKEGESNPKRINYNEIR
jgi:hypothetical protein